MTEKHTPQALAYDRLQRLERPRNAFYRDGRGVLTIGSGYTPIVMGRGGRWRVRPNVRRDFAAAGVALTTRQCDALAAIAREMNKGHAADADAVERAMAVLSDVTLSPEAQAALARPAIAEARRYARDAVGAEVFDALDPARQAELIVGAYQSPRAITEAGADLAAAIRRGDWEAAATRWQAIGRELGDMARYHGGAEILRDPDRRASVEVGAGDTLSGIARRHGVSLAALLACNPHLADPDRIRAGDVLRLPTA